MARVCKGGAYDGLPIHGPVDEASCLRNEGTIVDGPSTDGGCGTSEVARSAVGADGLGGQSSAFLNLSTSALRAARDRFKGSRLVRLLDEINDEIAPVLPRLILSDEKFRNTLIGIYVDISSMSASMLAPQSPEQPAWHYTRELHGDILSVTRTILASDKTLEPKLQQATDIAANFVGMNVFEIAKELQIDAEREGRHSKPDPWSKFSALGRERYLESAVGLSGSGKIHSGLSGTSRFEAARHLPTGLETDSGPPPAGIRADAADFARVQTAAIRKNDIARDVWLPDWARKVIDANAPPERMLEEIAHLLEDASEEKLLTAQALLNELARNPKSAGLVQEFIRDEKKRRRISFQAGER